MSPSAVPRLIVATLLLLLLPGVVHAGLDFDRGAGRWVTLSYQHTSFDLYDAGLFDANWVLAGRFAVGDGLAIRAEIPFTHLSLDVPVSMAGGTIEATARGNLYFALEVPSASGRGNWEFGVWAPTAPDDDPEDVAALLVAAAGDWVVGLERYYPNTKGAIAMAHIDHPHLGGQLHLRGDFGVSVADLASQDFKGFLLLGGEASVGTPLGPSVAAALQSRTSLSDIDENLAFVDFVAMVELANLPLQPSFQLRRPLDEDRSSSVNWSIGLALRAKLP